MSKTLRITLCALLVLALAVPVFANGGKAKRSSASIPGRIYAAAATATDRTANLATGCLKRSFSLFNPCLDFVKGCTDMVLTPIGKPFDYMEKAIGKKWGSRTAMKARPAEKH